MENEEELRNLRNAARYTARILDKIDNENMQDTHIDEVERLLNHD